MVIKTTPRKEYGYYCDVCGCKICKYILDFKACGGLFIQSWKGDEETEKHICEDCAKQIMEELLEAHGL